MNQPTTAAAIAAPLDPFDAVLQSLKESAQSVDGVLKSVSGVENVVTTVDDVLGSLSKLPADLNIIKDILKVLDSALSLLGPVPIVGEIANAGKPVLQTATTICKSVQSSANTFVKDIIDPVKKAIDDLRAGIQKAISILKTIALTIPDYINTIQILNYLNRIASPLVGLLKGTSAHKRLKNLTDQFDKLQKSVTGILAPVAGFIEDLRLAMGAIDKVLGKAFQTMKDTAAGILKGLHDIEKVFRPIRDGFNKIINAIKPVKWALEALSFIFDKIVAPVINKVLKATHLDKAIFDPLTEKIKKELGIDAVVQSVKGAFGSADLEAWRKQAGVDAVVAGAEKWGELAKALEKYNTRDSDGTKNDIMLLVNAITGGEIDPDKPIPPVPDWPDEPDFGDDKSLAGSLFADAIAKSSRQSRMESGFSAMARMQEVVSTSASPGPDRMLLMNLLDSDALAAGPDMPNVALLTDKARSAADALKQIEGAGGALIDNVDLFDEARHLPEDFDQQMDDFSNLFDSAESFVLFLKEFDFIAPIVADLVDPLNKHAELASGIKRGANGLVSAGRAVDSQIQILEAAAPRKEVFTAAYDFFDAAAGGAMVLEKVISEARQTDHDQLGGQFKARLDQLAAQVNDAAGGLVKQLEDVEGLATSALNDAGSINDYLGRYAGGFTRLHGSAGIIGTDALPSLTKGVHYFGVFVSILDPLSCLLQKTVCKEKDYPLMKTANRYVTAFENSARTFFTDHKQIVEQAFSFVIDQTVPMAKIQQDIGAITDLTHAGQADFDGAVSRVKSNLTLLGTAMQPAQHYTEGGVRIDNVLVDEAFAQTASALFEEIQKALPSSFEPA